MPAPATITITPCCPDCDGDGAVLDLAPIRSMADWEQPGYVTRDCSRCETTGRIEVTLSDAEVTDLYEANNEGRESNKDRMIARLRAQVATLTRVAV